MRSLSVLSICAAWYAGFALRTTPKTSARQPGAPDDAKAHNATQALADAESLVRALTPTTRNATQQRPTHNATQHRVKVDVGFAQFQQQLFHDLDQQIRESVKGQLNGSLIDLFVANFTSVVKAGMNVQFAKIKKQIGSTWMALPEDEQKNTFVHDAKAALSPVFANSMSNVKSHIKLYTRRLEALFQGRKPKAILVNEAVALLSDSLLKKHCFKDESKGKEKKSKTVFMVMKAGARNATASAAKAGTNEEEDNDDSDDKDPPGEFCVDSLVSALARRLGDAQSLVGMSMRYEFNAMQGLSLVQVS